MEMGESPAGLDELRETERCVGEVWASVLGVPRVAPDDNFFEMGGHSLNALQMLLRLHDRFGVEVNLADLYDAPVLRELTELLWQRRLGLGLAS
jgi:acyl carrier protein